jgi:hypothetical protein
MIGQKSFETIHPVQDDTSADIHLSCKQHHTTSFKKKKAPHHHHGKTIT